MFSKFDKKLEEPILLHKVINAHNRIIEYILIDDLLKQKLKSMKYNY